MTELPTLLGKRLATSWQEQKKMALEARNLGAKLREGKPISSQKTIGKVSLNADLKSSYVAALKSAMSEDDPLVRDGLLESLQMSAQGNRELDLIFQQVTSPA